MKGLSFTAAEGWRTRGTADHRNQVSAAHLAGRYNDPNRREIFREHATAREAGAPTNPDWYHNLTAAGDGSIERGTETYKVTVRELTGAQRDRIYAEQARRYPGFAGYERQTAGIRIIPVLELRRA